MQNRAVKKFIMVGEGYNDPNQEAERVMFFTEAGIRVGAATGEDVILVGYSIVADITFEDNVNEAFNKVETRLNELEARIAALESE